MSEESSEEQGSLGGPDFAHGVPLASIPQSGMMVGHANGGQVLVTRHGSELFATDAFCTHYGAPLADGLLVDGSIRCPWHHACFDLRTGEAVRAPALAPISCYRIEQKDGLVTVHEKLRQPAPRALNAAAGLPESVVILGGGAAGNAAAEMLRREGFGGTVTVLSADASIPYDRPNLSKGYLAGNAPEEYIPLRSPAFYEKHKIDLKLDVQATGIDTAAKRVYLADGSHFDYGALLIATGADPVRLDVPGSDLPHVHYLRSLADSRAMIATARVAHRAVVIGSSFIGLEVAAALRARNVEVDVITPESCPMERILGAEVGGFVRELHEQHGVRFHFGTTATRIDEQGVTLANGEKLEAGLVAIGIGVRPVLALAEKAGLAIDRGVTVDKYLQTSMPGVFAAGDIARWPDPLTGARIRVEHWAVAERQGQTAARNILGLAQPFDAVPFFWTEQYDFTLGYVGHAEKWDRVAIDGKLDARDCSITYWQGDRKLAVAVVGRDLEGLRAEVELERNMATR